MQPVGKPYKLTNQSNGHKTRIIRKCIHGKITTFRKNKSITWETSIFVFRLLDQIVPVFNFVILLKLLRNTRLRKAVCPGDLGFINRDINLKTDPKSLRAQNAKEYHQMAVCVFVRRPILCFINAGIYPHAHVVIEFDTSCSNIAHVLSRFPLLGWPRHHVMIPPTSSRRVTALGWSPVLGIIFKSSSAVKFLLTQPMNGFPYFNIHIV